MNPGTDSPASSYYTWQPPQRPITIQLQYDVVDRLLLEVMKGFGAVPRRGAEVGGLLLGSAQRDEDGHLTVRIDDFEPVPCEHANGPSFLLSENDLAGWRESIHRWQPSAEKRLYTVGYYRSHTRDGLGLAPEDLSLLAEYLPSKDLVSLIVKPYATRASAAGFFFWEGEEIRSDSPYLEFPFRRKELGGGASGLDRLASAARFGQPRPAADAASLLSPPGSPAGAAAASPLAIPPAGLPAEYLEPPPAPKPGRSGWVWIPLSFIFMLLGVILGFQIAISMRPRTPANPFLEAWNLALGVQRLDDRLVVSWDRNAPAVRNASRGVMVILAGDDNRRIQLSFNDLQAGQLIYRNSPSSVMFRLEVYPKDRTSVSETLEYRPSK